MTTQAHNTNRDEAAMNTKKTSRLPAPRMSKHGFKLYPAYGRGGEIIWVTIPESN